MACDIFDQITGNEENTAFYRGYWVSNEKHRALGMRIKMSRFIIPYNKGYGHCLDWDSEKRLSDFDKVFAMVDGKTEPEISLVSLFRNNFRELRAGNRLSATYFDVRYYQGIGTIHFFPRDKKLIDRFNRLVGRHRKWLPPEGERVSDEFWLQYEKAEKFEAEVTKQARKSLNKSRNLIWSLRHGTPAEQARVEQTLDEVLATVHEQHGINIDAQLEHDQPQQLLLAA